VCLLLAAGSCAANLTRRNAYGSFYDNLADERESEFSPQNGRLYEAAGVRIYSPNGRLYEVV
jgi:hypothetical protein